MLLGLNLRVVLRLYLIGFMALTALGVAEPTPIVNSDLGLEIEVDGMNGEALLEVFLVASPSSIHCEAPAPRVISVPWSDRLPLDLRCSWSVRLGSEGYWAPAVEWTPDRFGRALDRPSTAAKVTLRPTVEVAFDIAEHDRPDSFVASARWQEGSSYMRGDFPCRMEARPTKEWDLLLCEAPPVPLELLILQGDQRVPSYFWDVDTRRPALHLGRVQWLKGASLTGHVTPLGEPESLGKSKNPSAETRPPSLNVTLLPEAQGRVSETTERRLSYQRREAEIFDNGFFQLTGLQEGTYTLIAQLDGYAPARRYPVTVTSAGETRLAEPIVLAPPTRVDLFVNPTADPDGHNWFGELSRSQPFGRVMEVLVAEALGEQGNWNLSHVEPGAYTVTLKDSQGNVWLRKSLDIEPDQPVVFLEVDRIDIRGRLRAGGEGIATTLIFGTAQGELQFRRTRNEIGARLEPRRR